MESFFAFINRMKYINRWGLMRNTERENLTEHSYMVAVVAHALTLISNNYFGNNLNADKIAVKALFHDAGEIMTGDLPTPIKYLNNEITTDYKKIEELAKLRLIGLLPKKMQADYTDVFDETNCHNFVKYADKLCAYLKCTEELKFGNSEFKNAKESIFNQLTAYKSPEVNFFLEHFAAAFDLTLDELKL